MNTSRQILLALLVACLTLSCEQHHSHEHNGEVSKLLWEQMPCETFSSAKFLGNQDIGQDKGAWEVNSGWEIKERMGTLCNAIVERQFFVGCERLEEFGLNVPNAHVELSGRSRRVILNFGRKTPDEFGQYVYLVVERSNIKAGQQIFNSKEKCNGSLPSPINEGTKVLVIPAYHYRSLTVAIADKVAS